MAFALTIEMQEALSKLGLRPHILDDRPQRLRLLTLAAACHDDPDPIGSHEPAGSAADLGGCHCAEFHSAAGQEIGSLAVEPGVKQGVGDRSGGDHGGPPLAVAARRESQGVVLERLADGGVAERGRRCAFGFRGLQCGHGCPFRPAPPGAGFSRS